MFLIHNVPTAPTRLKTLGFVVFSAVEGREECVACEGASRERGPPPILTAPPVGSAAPHRRPLVGQPACQHHRGVCAPGDAGTPTETHPSLRLRA